MAEFCTVNYRRALSPWGLGALLILLCLDQIYIIATTRLFEPAFPR